MNGEVCEEEEYDVWTKYSFIKGQIPRFHFSDPIGLKLIEEQTPVILTGSDLVQPAFKWDLPYLADHLGPGPFAVFCNSINGSKEQFTNTNNNSNDSLHQMYDEEGEPPDSREGACRKREDDDHFIHNGERLKKAKITPNSESKLNIFKYFDDKKLQALQDKSSFVQEIVRTEIPFDEFLEKYQGNRSKERVYLQQPLNNTVGRQIAADFVGFNWPWVMERQKEWGWGPLTSNLLLIGQKGNVTPCHYDEQQNLFCQLRGSKRFLLFSPDNFPSLYPYPVHDPCDRQSQVDLDNPDFNRFPNFRDAQGFEAVVSPGDVLYIPMYWWHHVINAEDTIAINFWHKAGPNPQIEYPLKSRQKVAMIRNVEKMLLEALQDQRELKNVLHWLVDGRF